MTVIQVLDKSFTSYLSAEQIQNRIKELADQINTDYNGREVSFVVILNGAFMFAGDLMKHINLACEVTFVKVSSYKGTESSGRVDEIIGLTNDIANREVVVVEDIVDTGITMDKIVKILSANGAKSIKIASLLFKTDAFTGKNAPHYTGFKIENKFVVGYGLDYDEHGRNLDAIYQLKD